MIVQGIFHNGVVVPNERLTVPEGTPVTIEITTLKNESEASAKPPRHLGLWAGQVTIKPDFDELPDETREAFGMK